MKITRAFTFSRIGLVADDTYPIRQVAWWYTGHVLWLWFWITQPTVPGERWEFRFKWREALRRPVQRGLRRKQEVAS